VYFLNEVCCFAHVIKEIIEVMGKSMGGTAEDMGTEFMKQPYFLFQGFSLHVFG